MEKLSDWLLWYCYECDEQIPNLVTIVDSNSPNFGKECCCQCGSLNFDILWKDDSEDKPDPGYFRDPLNE